MYKKSTNMKSFRSNLKNITDEAEKFIMQVVYSNIEYKKDYQIIEKLKEKNLNFFLKEHNIELLKKEFEIKINCLLRKDYKIEPNIVFEENLWKIVYSNLCLDFFDVVIIIENK